jgi:hypothetical protein
MLGVNLGVNLGVSFDRSLGPMRVDCRSFLHDFGSVPVLATVAVSTVGVCVSSKPPGQMEGKSQQRQRAAEYARRLPST